MQWVVLRKEKMLCYDTRRCLLLGLQEALQKMEDYMNEEMSLKDTLSRISREMEGKIDNDSLQLMKDYFGKFPLLKSLRRFNLLKLASRNSISLTSSFRETNQRRSRIT